jgi:hypothetical protein
VRGSRVRSLADALPAEGALSPEPVASSEGGVEQHETQDG